MSALLDVNVLLALAWPNHVHHASATEWFIGHRALGWHTCPVTESGFIRVSSNLRATPDARTPGEAAQLLHRMTDREDHSFLTDGIRMANAGYEMTEIVHSSAQVTDLHLALLARSGECSFVTFDRGAAKIADLVGTPCTLLTM